VDHCSDRRSDPEAILAALGRRAGLAKEGQALVIIARTVKGWGVPALQGTGHHGTPVPKDQLDSVLGALDQRAKELGVAAISQEEMARGLPIAQPTACAVSTVEAGWDEAGWEATQTHGHEQGP
jgi:transketolase